MDIELSKDDIALMLAEIRRFCQQSIRPLVQRPESILENRQLDRLTRQAQEIGLINLGLEPGTGLWENPEIPGWIQFSTGALQSVARTNAGIAFHFHQLALGRYVRRCMGFDTDPPSVVCVQGTYGLARLSLARLIQNSRMTDEDQALLRDYFVWIDSAGNTHPILFQAAEDWRQLLVPCFTEDRILGWAAFAREDLDVNLLPNSHGLDETSTWIWQPRHDIPKETKTQETALPCYAKVLNIHAQALMAIGVGAVHQAYEKAAEYAALRKQGGKPIRDHAAVRLMLARCASTVRLGELLLDALAAWPASKDNLATALALRSQLHPLLCAAANDAMQVFGGSGYTREIGLEK
ncbi:MAG: acyl-CoA/acyl-ACP dehydrogenase, partial [Pirellulales bacterium]|nr:acyl-CoA/acyl-ACP dehydrogenase [Pirellulales bacterium]